ncbi:MAG: hypothetical protein AB9835_13395 [Eubacteriales bacterium]
MGNNFKNTYQDTLVCPLIITSPDGKILAKNISAEKILPYIRRGANILRYISGEPGFHDTNPANNMLILTLLENAGYSGIQKALVIPYKNEVDGQELHLLLFKATSIMLSEESTHIKSSLLKQSIPVINRAIHDIMEAADESIVKQTGKFIRNNCARIFQMDRLLSEFYIRKQTNQLRVRGIYEVRSIIRELKEYISDYSTYLGYRAAFNMEDNPFLIYAEPQHFYALLIFMFSLIYHYSTDGRINISYSCPLKESQCYIHVSTAYNTEGEYNRLGHTLTDVDLNIANFFAEICGCSINKRIDNGSFELELQMFQSEKIKGLLRSNPDLMYLCVNSDTNP